MTQGEGAFLSFGAGQHLELFIMLWELLIVTRPLSFLEPKSGQIVSLPLGQLKKDFWL